MKLSSKKMFRLFAVSEQQDENGQYNLMPFDNNAFNQNIGNDVFDKELGNLANTLYDLGEWVKVGDVFERKCDTERVIFDCYGKCFDIPNIMHKINSGGWYSRYYIVVDARLTDYQWVVAVYQGTVYSG